MLLHGILCVKTESAHDVMLWSERVPAAGQRFEHSHPIHAWMLHACDRTHSDPSPRLRLCEGECVAI